MPKHRKLYNRNPFVVTKNMRGKMKGMNNTRGDSNLIARQEADTSCYMCGSDRTSLRYYARYACDDCHADRVYFDMIGSK